MEATRLRKLHSRNVKIQGGELERMWEEDGEKGWERPRVHSRYGSSRRRQPPSNAADQITPS